MSRAVPFGHLVWVSMTQYTCSDLNVVVVVVLVCIKKQYYYDEVQGGHPNITQHSGENLGLLSLQVVTDNF